MKAEFRKGIRHGICILGIIDVKAGHLGWFAFRSAYGFGKDSV